jgi:hypothetical protein
MSSTAQSSLALPARAARLGLVVTLGLSLAGCATVRDSRINPFNWFGSETVITRAPDGAETGPAPETNPLIPERSSAASIFRDESPARYTGTLVSEVTELRVERAPGGAVIRASGVAASLGAFDVRLIPVETASPETLRFELRARQADSTRGRGTPAARSVTVAISLSDQSLAFVRTIEVAAAQNERSVRR